MDVSSIDMIKSTFEPICNKLLTDGKKSGLLFIEGRLRIEMINDVSFQVTSKCYFQDHTGKWFVKFIKPHMFSLEDLAESDRKLIFKEAFEYEIIDF